MSSPAERLELISRAGAEAQRAPDAATKQFFMAMMSALMEGHIAVSAEETRRDRERNRSRTRRGTENRPRSLRSTAVAPPPMVSLSSPTPLINPSFPPPQAKAGGSPPKSFPHRNSGEAALILAEIRELAENVAPPGQTQVTVIRKERVAALGMPILAAYNAVGGAQRILGATGEKVSFLAKDFADALTAYERRTSSRPLRQAG